MAGAASASPLSSARPVLAVDGRDNATLGSGLIDMQITDSADGMARCELNFGNWGSPDGGGFQYFGRDVLDFGKAVKVKLGDATLFEGRISAITARFPEGSTAQVGVCCEDRLQDLRMTRRTRSFADAALSDVLQRIAQDHGLQTQLDVSGETYKLLAQVNQSDLAFARELARREDVQIWVEGTQLKAVQRARRQGATVDLSWAGTLREFQVAADLAHQRTKLVGTGWSVADKKAAKHEADDAAIRSELGDGTSGAQTLQQAFGERVDTLAHGLPAADAQARALAEASFRHLARRFVVGRGVAETDPDLRVGAKVHITGVGPLFEGDYTVTETQILFDAANGLRTEFLCDRPAIGSH
jgi:phage protein D